MTEQKNSKVKMLLPAIAIATSFYYSFWFTAGVLAGYALCKIFFKLFVENGKVSYIFVDFGNWKLHLHHWIMGVALLAGVWVIDRFYLPTLFAGFVLGVIIHDIYDFNDWYKVLSKNKPAEAEVVK